MKERAIILMLFFCACAFAADQTRSIQYHPYRKVGEKYYSLQPLYEWMKILSIPTAKLTQAQRDAVRPMADWIGTDRYPDSANYKVEAVHPDGVMVQPIYYRPSQVYGTPFFLTNYPYLRQLSEGQSLEFLAIKTGVHEYADPSGGAHTVALYDYGVPYNPFKSAAERAITNSPAQ